MQLEMAAILIGKCTGQLTFVVRAPPPPLSLSLCLPQVLLLAGSSSCMCFIPEDFRVPFTCQGPHRGGHSPRETHDGHQAMEVHHVGGLERSTTPVSGSPSTVWGCVPS